jgi:tyrosine-protein kinase
MHSDAPRYATLQDYLRVIRSHRLLIVLFALAFGAAGLLLSLTQTKLYTAEAQLSFRDPTSALTLLGGNVLPQESPDQRAATNAALISRPQVARRVQNDLGTDLTISQLQTMVSAQVGARTNFVLLQAESRSATFAPQVANSFARQVELIGTKKFHNQVDRAIKTLTKEARGELPTIRQQTAEQQIAELRTLRSIAKPVEVAREAEVPTSPTSPRPKRNAVLGFIVGLAFGLLAAFGRDSLDRRLRAPHEAHEELGLPVLGRVSDAALGYTGFMHNGNFQINDPDLEAFRVLRTNLEFLKAGEPMKSVLVTSGLPEEGKSTVATALASAAVVAGKRTLLIECDLRRPSLATRLGIEQQPGLSDYLTGRASPREVLQRVSLPEPGQGPNGQARGLESDHDLVVICAGTIELQPAELLASERFHDLLEKVSKVYEMVVIDTSPLLSVVDALELVPLVDVVLICVRLSQTTRDQAKAALGALSHLPERPTGLVVTGLQPGDEYYGYYYPSYGAH